MGLFSQGHGGPCRLGLDQPRATGHFHRRRRARLRGRRGFGLLRRNRGSAPDGSMPRPGSRADQEHGQADPAPACATVARKPVKCRCWSRPLVPTFPPVPISAPLRPRSAAGPPGLSPDTPRHGLLPLLRNRFTGGGQLGPALRHGGRRNVLHLMLDVAREEWCFPIRDRKSSRRASRYRRSAGRSCPPLAAGSCATCPAVHARHADAIGNAGGEAEIATLIRARRSSMM